ncbi:MAG: hypothetical protein OEM67_11955 [Thermoleophilia bacterium]|nr:hypothetical protein [Thermoleophilia bacterium]
MPTPVGKGSIWEDGLGHGDKDARVVRRARTSHTPDPQSVRYGQGECEVIIEGVIAGPAFRDRPKVDVYWHEGLRPSFARLTPDEAREIAQMLIEAASAADQEAGDSS